MNDYHAPAVWRQELLSARGWLLFIQLPLHGSPQIPDKLNNEIKHNANQRDQQNRPIPDFDNIVDHLSLPLSKKQAALTQQIRQRHQQQQ
ncbi:MAG: hypothetical protein OEV23_04875 [Gallionella sp.]|nr:hypothetical protein [Gallionella sp.]